MRFLFAWQHVDRAHRLTGADGLRAVVGALDGFELPADAWERAVLPARLDRYEPSMLDMLCLTGEVGWGRLSAPRGPTRQRSAPCAVALFLREHADAWQALRFARRRAARRDRGGAATEAAHARAARRCDRAARRFCAMLATPCALDDDALRRRDRRAGDGRGLVTSDGFAGLRAIVRALKQPPAAFDRRRGTCRPLVGDAARRVARRAREAAVERAGAGVAATATASSSGACSRARRTPRPGAS